MCKIHSFAGENRFLSNFWEGPVTYGSGFTYRNAEAAFQAQKCQTEAERVAFTHMSAREAKRAGRRVTLRPDWEQVKVQVMTDVVRAKFKNSDLQERLINTGNSILVEGNDWGDTFWGVDICSGRGENHLGKILMQVRLEKRLERAQFSVSEVKDGWLDVSTPLVDQNGDHVAVYVRYDSDGGLTISDVAETFGALYSAGVMPPNDEHRIRMLMEVKKILAESGIQMHGVQLNCKIPQDNKRPAECHILQFAAAILQVYALAKTQIQTERELEAMSSAVSAYINADQDEVEAAYALKRARNAGLSDEDLHRLGFDWLLDVERS